MFLTTNASILSIVLSRFFGRRVCVCVCICVYVCVLLCVCACVRVFVFVRESVCMWKRKRERERECVCVCVWLKRRRRVCSFFHFLVFRALSAFEKASWIEHKRRTPSSSHPVSYFWGLLSSFYKDKHIFMQIPDILYNGKASSNSGMFNSIMNQILICLLIQKCVSLKKH